MEGRQDIEWWLQNVARSLRRIRQGAPGLTMLSDASNQGWGGGVKFGLAHTGGRWGPQDTFLHINAKETKACLLTLQAFLKDAHGVHVNCQLDNMTAVAYINHMWDTKSENGKGIVAIL